MSNDKSQPHGAASCRWRDPTFSPAIRSCHQARSVDATDRKTRLGRSGIFLSLWLSFYHLACSFNPFVGVRRVQDFFVMTTEPEPQESPPSPPVQLNPTVTPEQARPVPSFASESVAPAPPAPPAAEEESADEEAPRSARGPSATAVAPREKVEIPARSTALDADLEAEINAALSDAGSLA